MSTEGYGGGNTPAPLRAVSPEIAGLVERVQSSVVQVANGGRGAGAGVIWSAEGLVLTNAHVVAGGGRRGRGRGSGAKIIVALHDGREFTAEVAKSDRTLDLALLRLEGAPKDLPAARFGDSASLRVGEMVIAVGHPWGRLGAATAGVIGERPRADGPWGRVAYVRSDVTLAPGNSGGPLLNARGEVVGVNAMISGGTALSVPSDVAETWASAPEGEVLPRPRLGVGLVPARLSPSQASAVRGEGLGGTGLVVTAVEARSPAEAAGLAVGDVLVGVADEGGAFTGDVAVLWEALSGDALTLRVIRGEEALSVDVVLRASGPERAA